MTRPPHKGHRAPSIWNGWTRLRRLVAVSLVFSLTVGVAWAYFGAGSLPGGNGAAAAASMNQGATPTVVSDEDIVTVNWAASTLSDGSPVAGYKINRYEASSLAPQTIATDCAGTITGLSCIENAVPDGAWVYSVTPVFGSYWQGVESQKSHVVMTDSCIGCPPLRTAATYSVLAVTSVTSTGATSLSGDLGVSPAGTIVGFGPGEGSVVGSIHLNDSASAQAVADMVTAYDNVKARTPGNIIAGDLAGLTFYDGVYYAAGATTLSTSLTLDAQGDPNAVFIFQMDAAFAPAAASTIILVNGAQASHVFWQVTGAVSIGAGASFVGTILGGAAVTVGANALLFGRALSYGTVTLAANTITFN
jgi:hypothetical protein